MRKALASLTFSLYISNILPTFGSHLPNQIHNIAKNAEHPLNGVVLFAQGDKFFYRETFGSIGNPRIDSQFVIGSLTKQITAAVVLRMVDEDLINLDDLVSQYLPEIQGEWDSNIRIENLLNHTSGMNDFDKPLEFKPGENFLYSNANFELLGRIIKKITGEEYSTVAKRLFNELGMNDSFVPQTNELSDLTKYYPNLLKGTIIGEEGAKPGKLADLYLPAAVAVSTAKDLLTWNLALHSGQIISTKSYQLMITPKTYCASRWGTNIGYGYGIQFSQDEGITEISHNGIIAGYTSTLLYYPDLEISGIILENKVLWTRKWDMEAKRSAFRVHDDIRSVIREYAQECVQEGERKENLRAFLLTACQGLQGKVLLRLFAGSL